MPDWIMNYYLDSNEFVEWYDVFSYQDWLNKRSIFIISESNYLNKYNIYSKILWVEKQYF
jgi:hypothetical protein